MDRTCTCISFTLCIFLGTGGGTGSFDDSLLRPAAISLTLRNGEESAPGLPSLCYQVHYVHQYTMLLVTLEL